MQAHSQEQTLDSLALLPDEILLPIIKQLSFSDRLRLLLVSKRLNELTSISINDLIYFFSIQEEKVSILVEYLKKHPNLLVALDKPITDMQRDEFLLFVLLKQSFFANADSQAAIDALHQQLKTIIASASFKHYDTRVQQHFKIISLVLGHNSVSHTIFAFKNDVLKNAEDAEGLELSIPIPLELTNLAGQQKNALTEALFAPSNDDVRLHLPGLNLQDTYFPAHVKLRQANLSHSNLYRSILAQANLSDADLSGAQLVNVNFDNADLSGANLSRAVLRFAHLRYTNFTGANLSGAQIIFADCTGTCFKNANLIGTKFHAKSTRDCTLTGANFSGSRFIEEDKLNSVDDINPVLGECYQNVGDHPIFSIAIAHNFVRIIRSKSLDVCDLQQQIRMVEAAMKHAFFLERPQSTILPGLMLKNPFKAACNSIFPVFKTDGQKILVKLLNELEYKKKNSLTRRGI